MPPVKRPHPERPYQNEPFTAEAESALREMLKVHGLRGVFEALATIYAGKATNDPLLTASGRATMTRTARVLEMALDSLPLQVR